MRNKMEWNIDYGKHSEIHTEPSKKILNKTVNILQFSNPKIIQDTSLKATKICIVFPNKVGVRSMGMYQNETYLSKRNTLQ